MREVPIVRTGASPRGRRNPGDALGPRGSHGCISAWAEEPRTRPRVSRSSTVHLRVGGGTGSRMTIAHGIVGASPRGRRNRASLALDLTTLGCISAWAEEPASSWLRSALSRVHLRVGGGTGPLNHLGDSGSGASPRGRRNLRGPLTCPRRSGCISAWAEEPRRGTRPRPRRAVHLRVGGGTAVARGVGEGSSGASPRGRRNLERKDLRALAVGCISAWAEEPRGGTARPPRVPVHLRVGGGTELQLEHLAVVEGASPRGRRNHPFTSPAAAHHRCISAWAEEPSTSRSPRASSTVHLRVGGGTARSS